MKSLKKISLVLLLVVCLIPFNKASATETATNTLSPSNAKDGIVQVNTVVVDDDGEKYLVFGGTGFLIGDTEGTEYVITCNHIVNPAKDIKYDAAKTYGLASSENEVNTLNFSTEVVVEGDVVLSATVLTNSSDMDLAVLSLPQPIYTRTPLAILSSETYAVEDLPYVAGDAVYAYGYPEQIDYESETQYYSSQSITSAEGKIVDLVSYEGLQIIESDVSTDANIYGGPLVDANGFVIGMNLPMTDGDYECALDSTKITKVLDGLGVRYAKAQAVPKDAAESENADKEDKKVKKDTQKDKDELVLTPPVEDPKKHKIPESVIVIGALAVVFIVAVVILTVVMVLLNKKKKTKKIQAQNAQYQGPSYGDFNADSNANNMSGTETVVAGAAARTIPDLPPQPQYNPIPAGTDETTVLGAAELNPSSGETEILSQEIQPEIKLGKLIRKRTSEEIEITKTDFVLGKDSFNADYCLENNRAISRKHAIITAGRNGAYITDCNSTNGTWINGSKIESGRQVLLNKGDIIKIANEEFEYQE